jgi:hypothetical protein
VMESRRMAQTVGVVPSPPKRSIGPSLGVEYAPVARTLTGALTPSAFSPGYAFSPSSNFCLSPAYRPTGLYGGLGGIGPLRPQRLAPGLSLRPSVYDDLYEYECAHPRLLPSYPLGAIGDSDWFAPTYTLADVPSPGFFASEFSPVPQFSRRLLWDEGSFDAPSYGAECGDAGARWRTSQMYGGFDSPSYPIPGRPTTTYRSLGYRQLAPIYDDFEDPSAFATPAFAVRRAYPTYAPLLDEHSGLGTTSFRPLYDRTPGHRHPRASGLGHHRRCPYCDSGPRCPTCAQDLPY